MKRFIIFLLATVGFLSPGAIRLELEDGGDTSEVMIGDVFRVKAIVSSKSDSAPDVEINGIDKFNILGKSTSRNISLINGKYFSETVYSYKLKADKVGKYSIGPATIGDEAKSSNELMVKVKDPRSIQRSNVRNPSGRKVFLKMISNKENVVVGEPLILTARFYHRGSVPGNISLSMPKTPGFVLKESKQVQKGREVVNGAIYNVISKNFILTPINAGKKYISSIQANYSETVSGRSSWGGLHDFFGSRLEQRTATSNHVSINVDKVPGVVDAVGEFKNFALKVDSDNVNVNDPITLSVEIEGEGALDHIISPKIKLANVFKYYESKSNCDYEGDVPVGKKTFEYVLQGKQPGKWEIQSQKFTYFDTKDRSIKILESSPIFLAINGEAPVAYKPIAKPEVKKKKFEKDINFIEEDGPLFTGDDNGINMWIFMVLLLIPLILFTGRSFGMIYVFITRKLSALFWPHKPLLETEKRLRVLEKEKNIKKLYQLILNFLSDQFNASEETVGEDWIRIELIKQGWHFDRVESFVDFFNRLAGLSYSSFDEEKIDKNKLFSETLTWIRLIDGHLNDKDKVRG